jgi:predicted nucleic acid-binding protein
MLIDTSGFFCLYDKDAEHHDKAVKLFSNARSRFTTSYVIAEYVPLAQTRRVPQSEIIKFSTRILDDDEIEIVWIDEQIHREAVALIQRRSDKTYSLGDAVSFVLMRERQVTDALTTDHHFEKESFTRLLK